MPGPDRPRIRAQSRADGSANGGRQHLRADPAGVSREYQMEQNYVTHGIRGGVNYWPEPWTRHFRLHCLGPWPVRYLRAPKLPRGARIVTFPGRPNAGSRPASGKRGPAITNPQLPKLGT